MREIKFRVWDESENKMSGPGYGKYFYISESGQVSIHRDGEVSLSYWGFKVMQFTGLKDKNGKEIYEGDIVRAYSYVSEPEEGEKDLSDFTIHKIEWGDEYPAFDLIPTPEHECNTLQEYATDPGGDGYAIEVIGNIYENPELFNSPLASKGE